MSIEELMAKYRSVSILYLLLHKVPSCTGIIIGTSSEKGLIVMALSSQDIVEEVTLPLEKKRIEAA